MIINKNFDFNKLDPETWRKKPILVKAVQINCDFEVETLEGTMKGKVNDYLIKGIKGEFYPCDKEIFLKSYDKREMNFCKSFADKVAMEQCNENKIRHLLEDFFFNEGWASKTNPNLKATGHNAQLTYNEDSIKHFIEDFIRWFKFTFGG